MMMQDYGGDKMNEKQLDCLYCHKLFDVNNMYTVDACCEQHQKMLVFDELWGSRPEVKQINTLFVVNHESQFGMFQLKGIYDLLESAKTAWNDFVKKVGKQNE